MSTTENFHLEAVVEALVKKVPIDPAVENEIHEEAAKLQVKFDTEVSLATLRQVRDE